MKLPEFRRYVATKHAFFPGGKVERRQEAGRIHDQQPPHLLYNYEGAIGIKNGYTIAAQQTFIGAATREGRPTS
jgi:D-alanyl-D-alanine carboxypeptidase (penicillin-binding protein 5/6)